MLVLIIRSRDIKNIKPYTLTRVYAKVSRKDATCPIILAATIVAPVRWALETTVHQAQTREPDRDCFDTGLNEKLFSFELHYCFVTVNIV